MNTFDVADCSKPHYSDIIKSLYKRNIKAANIILI